MLGRKVVECNHIERERLSQEEKCAGQFDLERELKVLRTVGVVNVVVEVVLSKESGNGEVFATHVVEVVNHQQRKLGKLWQLRCCADKK
jgi:hypothetical protein